MEELKMPNLQRRNIVENPSDVGIFVLLLIMYSWLWIPAAWVSWRLLEWLFL